MKKLLSNYSMAILALALCLGLFIACQAETPAPETLEFNSAPVLTLTAGISSISYKWTAASPFADYYDVYWRQGSYTDPADVKEGNKKSSAISGGSISGLTNGQLYSVVVTAYKAGYKNADSAVRQATPNSNVFSEAPVLTLNASGSIISYTWTAEGLDADSYDVYWIEGAYTDAADVKEGTKISDAVSGGTISGLNNGVYSVVITVNKDDYVSRDSEVIQITVDQSIDLGEFIAAPVLTISASGGSINYTWTASTPAADSYDVYYRQGTTSNVTVIKSGTKISDAVSGGEISYLSNGTYSVMVAANKAAYASINSEIKQASINQPLFSAAPVLTLSTNRDSIIYTWTASNPTADSCDVYWREGDYSAAADIKAGTKISGAVSGGSINELSNGQIYSFLITAYKTGYSNIDSSIKQATPTWDVFTAVPGLALSPANSSIAYSWSASAPTADSYDVYWIEGTYSSAVDVKAGTKITGASSGGSVSGLTNDKTYSFVITANKAGYDSVDSEVKQEAPSNLPPQTTAAVLTLESADSGLICTWTDSAPAADSYDVYWIKGAAGSAEAVKAGTKIANVTTGGAIAGLTNKDDYSVIVTSNKSGYLSMDSDVKQAKPVPGAKRGVGRSKNDGNTNSRDWELLKPGLSWWYSWGVSPGGSQATTSKNVGVSHIPQIWRWIDSGAESSLRSFKASYPETEYVLAINEPNLTDQGNQTPSSYATNANGWPKLVSVAKELGMKVVSPAMNYGTLSGYGDPVAWLDPFFAHPNVNIDDCAAISVHSYMDYPSSTKGFITEKFAKYGKPIWLTEFCAWENGGAGKTWESQAYLMSNLCTYMELDPVIERYAWFIDKAGDNANTNPYNKLLTGASSSSTALTNLGKVYVYMGSCDQRVWAYPGQQIAAKDFTKNNLINSIGVSGLQNSVRLRPTTDTQAGAAVLDIHTFNANTMWVEYQVMVPEAKTYTLSLRYQTTSQTAMLVTVDGGSEINASLNSNAWTINSVDLGNLEAGKHTIRLSRSSGDCALNWLRID